MLKRLDQLEADTADLVKQSRVVFSFESISLLLPLIDMLIILGCSLAGEVIYQLFGGDAPASLFAAGAVAACIFDIRMESIGYYDIRLCLQSRLETGQIIRTWGISVFILVLLAFLFKLGTVYSRASVAAFLLLSPGAIIGWRAVMKSLLRHGIEEGVIGRRKVVVIGEDKELASLDAQQLLNYFGVIEASRFILKDHAQDYTLSAGDFSILKSAIDYAKASDTEEILLALSWRNTDALQAIRDELRVLPVPVRLLPDRALRTISGYRSFASALNLTFVIELQSAPLSYGARIIKRLMDVALGSIALVLLLPAMTVAAIAIKLDSPGPVVFRQRRTGFNGKSFVIYKFRTMMVQEDGATVTQASRWDPRVTRIGRLLRMTSIDELPQLLNVLRGEMSLIGPRPHALSHDDQFEKMMADYAFRRHVKPGITGWAQCHGARGATPSFKKISSRVDLDLWYINNWSVWLDIRILFMTVFEVLRFNRAY